MGHTVTGVDDGTSEGPVLHLGGGPRRSQGEDSLHGDVETGAVEGFEEDLGGVFSVLGGVQGLESTKSVGEPGS